LAVQMLALADAELAARLDQYRREQALSVLAKGEKLQAELEAE